MVHDFDYIYHKYYDDIYKYVYSYTLNEYDTEAQVFLDSLFN